MSDIHEVVKDIMEYLPVQQLTINAQTHLRTKIFTIVLKHKGKAVDELIKEKNELDRQLYIAKRKIEEFEADEAVDSAGFNK
jgi:hypothetical protein